jgi:hypothetical protein
LENLENISRPFHVFQFLSTQKARIYADFPLFPHFPQKKSKGSFANRRAGRLRERVGVQDGGRRFVSSMAAVAPGAVPVVDGVEAVAPPVDLPTPDAEERSPRSRWGCNALRDAKIFSFFLVIFGKLNENMMLAALFMPRVRVLKLDVIARGICHGL